eukprot:4022744-Amphidinium_carterae.1
MSLAAAGLEPMVSLATPPLECLQAVVTQTGYVGSASLLLRSYRKFKGDNTHTIRCLHNFEGCWE